MCATSGHLTAVPLTGTPVSAGKPTKQSSDLVSGVSGRAVDGNTATVYGGNSCTHTNSETDPYWRVDLQQVEAVGAVKLVNRGG